MKILLLWILTCVLVFHAIDLFATRPVPIYVEDFRRPGRHDEQILSLAVQEAYRHEQNGWWIHHKRPHLVFDARYAYNIDPSLYAAFDLEITTDAQHNMIGILRPTVAAVQAP